jgi:hypothetical protein
LSFTSEKLAVQGFGWLLRAAVLRAGLLSLNCSSQASSGAKAAGQVPSFSRFDASKLAVSVALTTELINRSLIEKPVRNQ